MFSDNNLVTVWSAPNYCYRCGNVASIMKIDDSCLISADSFKIFEAVPDASRNTPNKIPAPYFI